MTNDRESTILAILLTIGVLALGVVLWTRCQPQPPMVVTLTVTPSRTSVPVVSPTLTIVPQTATATLLPPAPTVTDTVTATEIDNPTATVAPTSKPIYTQWRVIKICSPKFTWEACYWRCCR